MSKKTKNTSAEIADTDLSPKVFQKSKLKAEIFIKNRSDLNSRQQELIDLAQNKNTKIIFVLGSSGTAKTYTSVLASLILLNKKKVSDILYIRSLVESSKSAGFLPGDIAMKSAPYIVPLENKLDELISKKDIEYLKGEGRIQAPLINYMRGLSFNVQAIIVDEAQNLTEKELITVITRCGSHSVMFICADKNQCDIKDSGLHKILDLFNDEESKRFGIHTIEFSDEEIVRSELVKFVVKKLKSKNKMFTD